MTGNDAVQQGYCLERQAHGQNTVPAYVGVLTWSRNFIRKVSCYRCCFVDVRFSLQYYAPVWLSKLVQGFSVRTIPKLSNFVSRAV